MGQLCVALEHLQLFGPQRKQFVNQIAGYQLPRSGGQWEPGGDRTVTLPIWERASTPGELLSFIMAVYI